MDKSFKQTELEKSFVCSEHFVSEWHEHDRDEVDYAPNLFVYKNKYVDQVRAERARYRATLFFKPNLELSTFKS